MLNKFRFRFRKNKSTNDAVATIIENIIESLNEKTKCNCILLDLSTAFVCNQQNILMDKLYKYGIRGIPHKLIKSYLRNRTQHVRVMHTESNQMKECWSSGLPVRYGVLLGISPWLITLHLIYK
jgi:hypothetical protein